MFSFYPDLYAMAQQGGGTSEDMLRSAGLFGVIFLIFWVLVIRPQQKKAKETQNMIKELKKGDQIITQSGIFGKVSRVVEGKDYIYIEIAEKTVIKMKTDLITEVVKKKITK